MFCNYCGRELPEDAIFCHQCGKQTPSRTDHPKTAAPAKSPSPTRYSSETSPWFPPSLSVPRRATASLQIGLSIAFCLVVVILMIPYITVSGPNG